MKIARIIEIGVILLVLFTSCSNFLKGNDILSDIEGSLLYINAPYVNVTFSSVGIETASIIPAPGTYSGEYKATDEIQIQFEPQINFYFTKWTAQPEDSVIFEDASKFRTTAKIVSDKVPIVITANTSPRPDIVTTSPVDEQKGVFRDRTIVVKFNHEMSKNSIYWTASELKKEGVDLKNAFKVDPSKSDTNALYYAYWDGKNNSSIKYKNIEIKKYLDQSVNLLEYYGIPKFDEGNTRILRIPTKLEDSAPPSVTDILVSIKKEVFCEIDNTEIGLSKNFEWTYFTNGSTDKDPPKFMTDGENKFSLWCTGIDGTARYELSEEGDVLSTTTTKSTFQENYSKDKKLYVKGCFEDSGSGPGSLEWKISKVNSKLYDGSSGVLKEGMVNFTLEGTTARFDGKGEGTEIDLTSLQGEGLYKIDFIAKDNNAKESAPKSFYFFHDSIKPQVKKHTITPFGKNQLLIEFSNLTMDYSHAEVVVDSLDKQTSCIETGFVAISCKCDNQNSHTLKIIDYDIAGNSSDEKSYSVTLTHKPAIGMILYSSGRWANSYVTKDAENKDIGTPVGIIWNTDDIKKCQVWALDETTECCWGSEGSDSFLDGNNSDYNGYNSYQTVCKSYSDYIEWTHQNHPSMWYYTYQKNNYASQKYSSLGITWFIPSVSDFNKFKEVYDVVENTINKLPETLSVPELTYDIGTTKNKSFENTYHPAITYVPNPFDNSSTEFLYLSANTSGNAGGHGIYWPVGFYSRTSYSGNSYPSSFYNSKTNHFSTSNANSPVKGIIDTHSTFVRSSFYRSIAHTMGQVDLSK